MSKSQKPVTTTSTTNTQVPGFVQDFQKFALDKGRNILEPYLNNRGYGVAGFNQDQNTAFQGIRDMAGAHGGGLDPNAYKTWMNPYQEAVVDTTTGRIQRQGDEALNAIRGRQAAGSAFGGMGARSAFAAQQAQEGTQRQIAETTAQLMSQGYTQAQAQALANRGLQQQSLQALLGIGGQQQALEQTKMDVPLKALGIAQGVMPQQFSSSSTGTQTAPNTAPSPFQQVLGLAGTLGGAVLGGPMGASLGGMIGGGLAAAPQFGQAGYNAGIRPTWG